MAFFCSGFCLLFCCCGWVFVWLVLFVGSFLFTYAGLGFFSSGSAAHALYLMYGIMITNFVVHLEILAMKAYQCFLRRVMKKLMLTLIVSNTNMKQTTGGSLIRYQAWS